MLVHRRVTPSSMLPVPILYTWVERDNEGKSFLSKETTRWQGLGLEPPTVRCWVQRSHHYTTASSQLASVYLKQIIHERWWEVQLNWHLPSSFVYFGTVDIWSFRTKQLFSVIFKSFLRLKNHSAARFCGWVLTWRKQWVCFYVAHFWCTKRF